VQPAGPSEPFAPASGAPPESSHFLEYPQNALESSGALVNRASAGLCSGIVNPWTSFVLFACAALASMGCSGEGSTSLSGEGLEFEQEIREAGGLLSAA